MHRADGSTVAGVLPGGTVGFAPLGDGWVVATRDDEGATFARFVPADGMSTQVLFDLDGGLATSPLGDVVAFAQPDGQVKVMQAGGAEQFYLAPIDAPGAYDAVAVTSEDCKEGRTTEAGCMVYVNTKGEAIQAWYTSSHGIVDQVDGEIDELTAWSSDRYAGIVERRDDLTTCSVVRDTEEGETLWETCDNRIMDFSPTGATAFGVGSVGDGLGDGQVTLLDAADGSVLVDLITDEQHQVFVDAVGLGGRLPRPGRGARGPGLVRRPPRHGRLHGAGRRAPRRRRVRGAVHPPDRRLRPGIHRARGAQVAPGATHAPRGQPWWRSNTSGAGQPGSHEVGRLCQPRTTSSRPSLPAVAHGRSKTWP